MAILTVGQGKLFQTVSAAALAAAAFDEIWIDPGLYVNDFINNVTVPLTIKGVGGLAHLHATIPAPNDRGMITIDADTVLDHLELSGAAGPSGNDAGVRWGTGNLTIRNSYFHNNQNGILGNNIPGAVCSIDHSEFAFNGTGDGHTHNVYIGHVASLAFTNCYSHDVPVGNLFKSRAAINIVEDNRIDDLSSTASYSLDFSNGGDCTVRRNFIQQGPNGQNGTMIAFGAEGALWPVSQILVDGNIFLNQKTAGFAEAVFNFTKTIAAQVTNNNYFGLTAAQIAGVAAGGLPAFLNNNKPLATAPAIDQSSPIQNESFHHRHHHHHHHHHHHGR